MNCMGRSIYFNMHIYMKAAPMGSFRQTPSNNKFHGITTPYLISSLRVRNENQVHIWRFVQPKIAINR